MKKILTSIIGEYESKIFYPFMLVIIVSKYRENKLGISEGKA